VLAMYEARAGRSFDLVEPFARGLQKGPGSNSSGRELLQQIGVALLSEHNLVGRVEVIDKPEIIWEHPNLERLYLRLQANPFGSLLEPNAGRISIPTEPGLGCDPDMAIVDRYRSDPVTIIR